MTNLLPTDQALPPRVADWIGKVAVVEEDGVAAERSLIEAFAVAVEDANPLYWDKSEATEIAGGIIAPPAMLSSWTRPHVWTPSGPPAQRPLELHFRLKEIFGLPKAVVIETDAAYHEPVRPGDRVRAEQILDDVGPVIETQLGIGRKWTISVRYSRQDGVSLGVETLRFFAYGGQGAESRPTAAEQASPSPQPSPIEGEGARMRVPPPRWGRLGDCANLTMPPLTVDMTAMRIIMGAAASRDWQPQHHDSQHAQASGLPDVILNAPSQAGWLIRYLTDWAGPESRVGRMRFRMVKPIAAGHSVAIQGSVEAVANSPRGWSWLRIALTISSSGQVMTDAAALLATPLTVRPWRADSGIWHIPSWDLTGVDLQGVSA